MRAGRHYAQFTVLSGDYMFFGVIRPGWDDVEGGQDHTALASYGLDGNNYAPDVDGHCFYRTFSGRRFPGSHDWEGMQRAQKEGNRIGMLLDLDQGSMTVYTNDERLGVMGTGLSGEYSWAVSLSDDGSSARIEAAPVPAPATAEEQA
jgi:hypothetical protein